MQNYEQELRKLRNMVRISNGFTNNSGSQLWDSCTKQLIIQQLPLS